MRICGAALLALMVMSAAPAQANMSGAFGNTVMSRYAHGGWVKHWFEADGAYRAQFSSGRTITARWRIEGEGFRINSARRISELIDAQVSLSRFRQASNNELTNASLSITPVHVGERAAHQLLGRKDAELIGLRKQWDTK